MKIIKCAVFSSTYLLVLGALSMNALADSNQNADIKQEAVSVVKQYAGILKPMLKSSIEQGSYEQAIKTCSEAAPGIAIQISNDTGWSVKRVSLKPRNTDLAMASLWETKVLKQFDERQASGESALKMAYAEKVDGEFRFMKAMGVEGLCLNCHGDNIKPEIKKALTEYYPNDTATGYKMGEIRGAISISKKL